MKKYILIIILLIPIGFIAYEYFKESKFLVLPRENRYAILIHIDKSAPAKKYTQLVYELQNYAADVPKEDKLYGEGFFMKSESSNYFFVRINKKLTATTDFTSIGKTIDAIIEDEGLTGYVESAAQIFFCKSV